MQDIVAEYHELLTADESLASLDRALRLLVRIASGDSQTIGNHWYKLLSKQSSAISRLNDAGASIPKKASEVSRLLSRFPKKISQHLDALPQAQYSVLMDTLLLVFHQAYFSLLPKATNERKALLDSFESFSAVLPRASDRFQTQGLVELERGNFKGAVDSFRAALAATHADEHDFMTRVQMVWSVLMERRRGLEAFAFLMDTYPRVSRSDLGEVSQMLWQTFIEGSTQKRSFSSRQ